VAESGLPLGCAHIGGKSTYAISCVPPHSGLPNTSSLRRLCMTFARPSHQHSYCGVVRPLLIWSNQHGDCLKERAARVHGTITLSTQARECSNSPLVVVSEFYFERKSIALGFRRFDNKIDARFIFSTCEGAKSCPDFCGGVYINHIKKSIE
jgi:hypothetical protein